MFEITLNAKLAEGRKVLVQASGSTNAHGFTADVTQLGTTLMIQVRLTKPVKNDPNCGCSGCGCKTANPKSALDDTYDIPEGVTTVVVKAPLCDTIELPVEGDA